MTSDPKHHLHNRTLLKWKRMYLLTATTFPLHLTKIFANENAHHIDLESEEYQLVYTELHEEFVRIFEEQMEGFIESQGSSAAEASAHSCSVVCRFGLW